MRKAFHWSVAGAVLLGAFVADPGRGAAQTSRTGLSDRAVIEACVKAAEKKQEPVGKCLFILTDPCLEKPTGGSTQGQAECFRHETAVWDAILNENYTSLRAVLGDKQRQALRDVQRAWIASRDKTCGFYREFYQGGTMAIPAGAACMTRETANRALYLGRFIHEGAAR